MHLCVLAMKTSSSEPTDLCEKPSSLPLALALPQVRPASILLGLVRIRATELSWTQHSTSSQHVRICELPVSSVKFCRGDENRPLAVRFVLLSRRHKTGYRQLLLFVQYKLKVKPYAEICQTWWQKNKPTFFLRWRFRLRVRKESNRPVKKSVTNMTNETVAVY